MSISSTRLIIPEDFIKNLTAGRISASRAKHSLFSILDEVKNYGTLTVDTTAELASLGTDEPSLAVVKDKGLYKLDAAATPNNTTSFPASGGSGAWVPLLTITADGGGEPAPGVASYKGLTDIPLSTNTVNVVSAGVLTDGTDQTIALNNLFASAGVDTLVFDKGNVTITGTVNTTGKTVVFSSNARLQGSGTLTGALIECNVMKQCFGADLTVTNVANTTVSVRWFGAQPNFHYNSGQGQDNLPFFQKAIACFNTSVFIPRIYAPGSPKGSTNLGWHYRFSATLEIGKRVELYGDTYTTTSFLFPGTGNGIWVKDFNGSRGYYHDFSVWGGTGATSTGYNSTTAHGLNITGYWNRFERISVNNFDGDGFHLFGSGGAGSNASLNKLYHCEANGNGRYGFYMQGGDCNAGTTQDCSATKNGRWGWADLSFLGWCHISNHCAANAQDHPLNLSLIKRGTDWYYAKADSINIEPEVTAGWGDYWRKIGSYFPPFNKVWAADTQYYSGGAYLADGDNQQGLFLDCYKEEAEPTVNNSPSLFLGGFAADHGSTVNSLAGVAGQLATRRMVLEEGTGIGAPTLKLDSTGIQMQVTNGSQWKLNTTVAGFTINYGNLAGIAMQYYSPAHGSILTDFDRAFNDNTGRIAYSTGIWIKKVVNVPNTGARYRNISLSDAVPTTGDWAVGDLVLNTGSSTAISHWKCITASVYTGSTLTTPAVFEAKYSGSYLRNYTPTGATDAAVDNGEMTYDTDNLYLKIAGTIKQVALSAFSLP